MVKSIYLLSLKQKQGTRGRTMKHDVYKLVYQECAELVREQVPMTWYTHLSIMNKVQQKMKKSSSSSTSSSSTTTTATASRIRHRRSWESYQHLDDVDMDSTLSVYLQIHKNHIKRNAHVHKHPEKMDLYLQRLRRGESIVDVAKSVHFPPYMLMKFLIKYHSSTLLPDKKKKLTGTAGHEIEDSLVREAVQQAAAADTYCSPAADLVRLNVGVEFEVVLQQRLQQLGIAFQSEDQMRDEGRSKTPDIRLIVPFAVLKEDHTYHVVNWIDSKAMFGDPHTHEENQNQLQGYVIRYGPGMVIYWFDYVNELNNDPDVLICRDLPSEYISGGS